MATILFCFLSFLRFFGKGMLATLEVSFDFGVCVYWNIFYLGF